jgi:CDP-diacylglycerol--serine O-phosphatidyltransferase
VRAFVSLANAITSCSLGAGFLAILLGTDGALAEATVAVAIAGVLDAIDGCVARRARASEIFGCQLDSLADLVAFGVAPAVILQESVPLSARVPCTGACMIFVVAGAWRLARFAVVHDCGHFVGLPIPPAGLIAAAAAALAVPAEAALGLCLVLALLMVSSIPFPTLPTVARLARRRAAVSLALLGGDRAADGTGARQRAGARSDDRERDHESHDDERVGAPPLARK